VLSWNDYLNMQRITRTHSSTTTTASYRARRVAWRSTLVACAVGALAAPGVASAADTLIAPDPAAAEVAALDGTVVWASGAFGEEQVLMQRAGGVIRRVKDAPRAYGYGSIDLGHNTKGRVVLTYQRCSKTKCTPIRDNLAGQRVSYKHLTIARCGLTAGPAVSGTRVAYGLYCRTPGNRPDDKRSGLYVKNGSGSPRRLRLPADAVRFGVTNINAVDMRGTRVAAIAADVYEYAFTETVNKNGLRSLRVASSEGEQDQQAKGVSLGTNNAMWTLVESQIVDEANRANIFKVSSTCFTRESIVNPPGKPEGFVATHLAVDRTTLYLVVPGAGIVQHDFVPQTECREL